MKRHYEKGESALTHDLRVRISAATAEALEAAAAATFQTRAQLARNILENFLSGFQQKGNIMDTYEIKRKIVISGQSEIFKNWQNLLPNLTEEIFINGLKWACEDPETREIGLTRRGIVHLIRHTESTLTTIRYENGNLWEGDSFLIPCSDKRYADENGMTTAILKLSINAHDKI